MSRAARGSPPPTPRTSSRASGPAVENPGWRARERIVDPGPVVAHAHREPAVEDADDGVAEARVDQVVHHLADGRGREGRPVAHRVAEGLDEARGVVVAQLVDDGGLGGPGVDREARRHGGRRRRPAGRRGEV